MSAPNISFEFFPPQSLEASFRLWDTVQTLAPLAPRFVSVTYGAGGTTRDLTHDAVTTIGKNYGLNVAAHLTCVEATRAETLEIARHADLLVHEATFADEEADRARDTDHSTAREAAELARDAGVERLVLTHISPRYGLDPFVLEREAREAFPGVVVAKDGLVVDVPLRDDEGEA